ncbi:phosphatidate cytidylyltransferase [Dehalococcoidia bacterium]|nr:phosphatidate cytidylyltransferase [Dehalococcoidia bacterium]
MLRRRVITSLAFVPVLLAAVWFSNPWLSIVVALAALLGTFEFYRLSSLAGWQPFTFLGTLFVLLFILNAHSGDVRTTPFLISGVVILSLIRLLWCADKERAFTNWAWTMAAIFYIGWTMSHFVLLRGLEDGRSWVLVVLLVTFASDTSAFLVGRAWGRKRMLPAISPGKTWEGAVGGIIGAMIALAILHPILGLDKIGYGGLIILGFLISIFAQLGDLAGSMLKRTAGVKEAGKLMPGHGGLLDRLDSLIFTVVLVYYYVVWIVG